MYDHYVAVDWALKNMAVARMTSKSDKITTIDVDSCIKELQIYLKSLSGKIILTFEESTPAQWLYTELREYVDKVIVCDPWRNKLLSEGAKSDKIDAEKMVKLLRAGMLKEVFHSSDDFIYMRKLVSAFEDVVKAGVRAKNQQSAIYRASNLSIRNIDEIKNETELFVLKGLDASVAAYETERNRYTIEFQRLAKKHKVIRHLQEIPGIGKINSVKIAAKVVDPSRFKDRGHWLSYCGLIKLERISGGRSYGRRSSRYSRSMKSAFKTAALKAIGGENEFSRHYHYLITEKNFPEFQARHAVCRRIASVALGVMKSGGTYDPKRKKKNVGTEMTD